MKISLLRITLFVLFISIFSLSVFAQKEKLVDVGKTGNFHIDSSVLFGGSLLESGMYKIEILVKGGERFAVVRLVEMNKYGRSMGSLNVGDEVARVKCLVEAIAKQNEKTKILVRRNKANKREAVQIWFKGERVKYVFPSN